jgi:hypothetical protein
MAFCDSSVKQINYSIDGLVYGYLRSRNDGNVIDAKKATGRNLLFMRPQVLDATRVSHDLTPRRVAPPPTLEALFRRDRIFEAARVVKFDVDKTLLAPLSPRARQIYLGMRWSIAPHRLAADLPVIQCLPPADKRREWPWETWYTDGKTPLIHHVHLTVPNNRTEPKSWRERDGAPQRPAELFGVNWYWYNDLNMAPALANA